MKVMVRMAILVTTLLLVSNVAFSACTNEQEVIRNSFKSRYLSNHRESRINGQHKNSVSFQVLAAD
jgi:hypothetical protein